MKRLMKLSPIVVGIAAMIACGSDSTAPPSGLALVGTFNAVEFTTTGSSGQTNQLLAGATLTITLASDHTTSGHLHVPASPSTGPTFDSDLPGTWAQSGNSVDFTQPNSDTFVEDMTFTAVPASSTLWDLIGDGTFSGTAIHVTLRQQINHP
jgi:hypothetical protein